MKEMDEDARISKIFAEGGKFGRKKFEFYHLKETVSLFP